jgi:hypothetical protein
MGGGSMKALLVLIIEDTPADAVPWPAIAPELEDLVARHLELDGDQVGLRVLAVTDTDEEPDATLFDDLWYDEPLVVDVPVGAYL